jgi:hypothetical protein
MPTESITKPGETSTKPFTRTSPLAISQSLRTSASYRFHDGAPYLFVAQLRYFFKWTSCLAARCPVSKRLVRLPVLCPKILHFFIFYGPIPGAVCARSEQGYRSNLKLQKIAN